MEEKKKLQAEELNEGELDKVVGGIVEKFPHKCNDCGYSWASGMNAQTCPSCKSRNVE